MSEPTQRPNVAMSQEEHASIQEVKTEVRSLSTNLDKFCSAVDKRFTGLEDKQAKIAESKQLSLQNVATFIGMALLLAGAVSTLNSMTIKTTIATDVTPILSALATQNTVSSKDQAGLHEDVKYIHERIDAGREARLQEEKSVAVRLAILEDHDKQHR